MNQNVGTLLGKGTFSHVYLIERDGRKYACKKVKTPLKAPIGFLMTQLNIIRICKHPHIVGYYGMEMNSFLSIDFILEYVNGGTLREAYKEKNEELLFFWTYQILKAFVYLEEQHIVHRDIKPSNILVHKSGIVKISDFGAAKFMSIFDSKSEIVGTPGFLPPELVVNNEYTYKSDLWSLGISLYELCHGSLPFPSSKTKQQYLKNVLTNRITCDATKCSDEMQLLISCLLRRNPGNRKSAKQILLHDVFLIREQQLDEKYEMCLKNYYASCPE